MSNKELNVVIGTGALGLAVMDELVSQGRHVRLVNRTGIADVPNSVSVVKADVTETTAIRKACEGATVIYHCAVPDYGLWKELFPSLMQGIIEVAEHIGAKVVYADNLYMYGLPKGKITEDLPTIPVSKKGEVRMQVADMLLNAHQTGKVKVTIARGSDFFGERVRTSSLGEQVFGAILEDQPASVLGNIDLLHTYTYIRDFAKAMVILADHEKALGEVWHVPNSETKTTRQFIEQIYALENKQARFRIAPKFIVTIMALFNKNMKEIKEIKEMLYQYENSCVVDHSKFEQAFDMTATPYKEAIKATMSWYKNNF